MKKIIHCTGLPRAMTTLMCNVLANNPNIGGGETSPLLEYIFGARANYSTTPEVKSALTEDVVHQSFLNFCREGMYGYADKITDKPIYLDKSRGWLHYADFLWEINPNAKIIVMVRDVRSVLSSFEKKWRENPSIMDSRDNQGQQNFITPEQRVNFWLNDPPLGIALKRLYNAIQVGSIKNMLVVRAEDFCKNPETTMKKVYEFIEEPYYEMDYSKVKQVTVENDRISDFGIYGDHTIREKIEPLKIDYNEVLSPILCSNVKSNYNWFFQEYKYF
jgi:sulfotransferase